MKASSTSDSVNTVASLQALLSTAVADLRALGKRDIHTIRATVSVVNSGNALLRTELSQNPARPTAATPKAKPRK